MHKEKFDFVSHVFKTSILVGWQLVFKTFPPSLSLFLSFLYRTGCHSFLLFISPPPKNYLPILLKIVFLSHSLDDAVRHVFVLYCSRPIICSYGAARLQRGSPHHFPYIRLEWGRLFDGVSSLPLIFKILVFIETI